MSSPLGETRHRPMAFSENTNIHSKSNELLQQTRKTLRRDDRPTKGNGPPACKRPALSTITNGGRIQPARAVKQTFKQSVGSENVPPSAFNPFQTSSTLHSTKPNFSIHVDEPDTIVCENNLRVPSENNERLLDPSVTGLPRQTILGQIDEPDCVFGESPMSLDSSLTELHACKGSEPDLADSNGSVYEVTEYAEEVFDYLRQAELRNRPKPGYMKRQPDITSSMRCILVDWLVEVSEEYKLNSETLYLAVSYIDRFLSHMSVLRAKLQLVGTACVFVAAKFEEIYPPDLKEFVYITDDTYSARQVLRMEHMILKVLSFDLAVPTINVFLPRYIEAGQGDSKLEYLSKFLAELFLQHFESVKYLPSTIAASAVCLARHTLHYHDSWTPSLVRCTDYEFKDIFSCVRDLHQIYKESPSHSQQAVRDKFKSQRYCSISLTVAQDEPPTC